jgi:hypothetical protein
MVRLPPFLKGKTVQAVKTVPTNNRGATQVPGIIKLLHHKKKGDFMG